MAEPTLIKRYPNRRLYDTGSSRYITLEELAARVREGEEIRVVDSATDEVITHRILLQLVLLEGLGIAELLPAEFLYLLLRLRTPAMIEMFVRYLRSSMEAFQFAHTQLEDNLRRFEEQARLTANLMGSFFPFSPFAPPDPRSSEAGPPRTPGAPPPAAPPTTPLQASPPSAPASPARPRDGRGSRDGH